MVAKIIKLVNLGLAEASRKPSPKPYPPMRRVPEEEPEVPEVPHPLMPDVPFEPPKEAPPAYPVFTPKVGIDFLSF